MAASARAEGSFEVRRASSASWYGRVRSLPPAVATQSEKPTTMAGTGIGSRIPQACAKTERRPGGEPPGRRSVFAHACGILLPMPVPAMVVGFSLWVATAGGSDLTRPYQDALDALRTSNEPSAR